MSIKNQLLRCSCWRHYVVPKYYGMSDAMSLAYAQQICWHTWRLSRTHSRSGIWGRLRRKRFLGVLMSMLPQCLMRPVHQKRGVHLRMRACRKWNDMQSQLHARITELETMHESINDRFMLGWRTCPLNSLGHWSLNTLRHPVSTRQST